MSKNAGSISEAMYLPELFRQTDRSEALRLIRSHPFATVMTWDEASQFVDHLPVLLDEQGESSSTLIGHLARANPQVRHFKEGREALVIFHGPHAYISPRWYRGKDHVPTWNYAVVQVRGKSRAVDEQRLLAIVERSVEVFESKDGYRFSQNPGLSNEFRTQLLDAIVGFEIEMTHLESKFKLSQNRSPDDYAGVMQALAARPDDMSRELHELMSRNPPRSSR